MLTEEQARTKWCPFARSGNEAGCNRNGGDFELQPRCIADACMAWVACESTFSIAEDRFLKPGETYPGRDPNFEQRPNGSGWCGMVRGLD